MSAVDVRKNNISAEGSGIPVSLFSWRGISWFLQIHSGTKLEGFKVPQIFGDSFASKVGVMEVK
jgi:hypothetical protein